MATPLTRVLERTEQVPVGLTASPTLRLGSEGRVEVQPVTVSGRTPVGLCPCLLEYTNTDPTPTGHRGPSVSRPLWMVTLPQTHRKVKGPTQDFNY